MTNQEHLVLTIEGMTCDSCAVHVEKALRSVAGVKEAEVPEGWQSGKARVKADSSVSAEALSTAVREAGYSATFQHDYSFLLILLLNDLFLYSALLFPLS